MYKNIKSTPAKSEEHDWTAFVLKELVTATTTTATATATATATTTTTSKVRNAL